MLLPISWLRDYLVKSDVKIQPQDLADRLTMTGIQVAAIKHVTSGLESVVVGLIKEIEKHPNADRLQVTKVVLSESSDASPLTIVCGAKNIAVGDMVPIAKPGSILPGNFEIKISTIRGVESHGMICSGKELGISEDSEGILQLPKHSVIGQPISRLLGKGSDEIVLEMELTPNRGDCLSVYGLAREIAPLLNTKLREPKPTRFKSSVHRTSSIIKVEVEDPNICQRYVARVVDTLKVAESPEWIRQRLETVSIRPINNIVDITNFVMFEYGQPLHAFDLRKIESGTIRIARCKGQMEFTLLNGNTVQLEEGDILIQDGDRPIALAGIMGGVNSQIEPDTTSIVLESAAFPASQIRKTAKRLGLQTDASKRFEKGTDIAAVALASERASGLLRDSFNANVYHPPIDTNEFGVKEPILPVDMREVRKVTGIFELSSETAGELLESIGIFSHRKSVNVLSVRLPTHRPDLRETIDIIEEVARLNGYDSIPLHFPLSRACYEKFDETEYYFLKSARNLLARCGLRETIHYSFSSQETLTRYGCLTPKAIFLKNPISEEMKVMRESLMPSLLQTYLYNKNRRVLNQKIFECAKTYEKDSTEEIGVKEICRVAALLSGSAIPEVWRKESIPVDFYVAKGIVERLIREIATVFPNFEPIKNSTLFHPKRSAVVKLGLREIGQLGEVHPFIRSQYLETTEPLILLELNLDALKKYSRTQVRYQVPSKFPASEIDIALMVEKSVASAAIHEAIKNAGGILLTHVLLFDVYDGQNIQPNQKSLAFRLTFQSNDRTLSDEEVVELRDKIIKVLSDKFNAQWRK